MAKEGEGRMPDELRGEEWKDVSLEDAHPDLFTQEDDERAGRFVYNFKNAERQRNTANLVLVAGLVLVALAYILGGLY